MSGPLPENERRRVMSKRMVSVLMFGLGVCGVLAWFSPMSAEAG